MAPNWDKSPLLHPNFFATGKMPWHDDDKPFGMTQDDWTTHKLLALVDEVCEKELERLTEEKDA